MEPKHDRKDTKMNDDFIITSTAFDAFHSIMTDYKQDFDKETLDTLTKKMFDPNLKNETDVKLVIPVQDKEGHYKVFKFQIGSGVKEKMLNIKEVDKYPDFVTIPEAPRIFNIIKTDHIGKLDEKIKDDLDEHISNIHAKLKGKSDVRFLIYVPLTNGQNTECMYKIGSGGSLMVIQLGRKTQIDHFMDFGKHLLSHKIYLCLVLPLVLFVAGYNATDMIKVIHVFDPLVSNKMYEVLILLLNRTDEAQK